VSGKWFGLNDNLKRRLEGSPLQEVFKELEGVEVDELAYELLTTLEQAVEHSERRITELRRYEEREMDAFAIGDAVSDGICMADGQGIVLAINRVYTEITGITEDMIVGQPIQKLLDEGYFNRAVTYMVIEQKKRVSQFSTIARNGKKVLITGNPFFSEAGEVRQVLTVMRDLTELLSIKDKLEKAERESERYRSELDRYKTLQKKQSHLIGEAPSMKQIKELIKYVAGTDATVLITGETGSGKEVVAKEIHENSGKTGAPYIKVNCAAIPDSLLESELFGYEKGAFTGALNKEKPGMFELANGGTLLLDEIGEMPMMLQSKLLRVLAGKRDHAGRRHQEYSH
jgi:PAS domain S-box-containing protein